MQTSKSFLISVGSAVAALIAGQASAKNEAVATARNSPQAPDALATSTLRDVVARLLYEIGSDRHALVLKKTETGGVYAQHSSHASHGSHGSHRSGF
jgi:hypothetical protein